MEIIRRRVVRKYSLNFRTAIREVSNRVEVREKMVNKKERVVKDLKEGNTFLKKKAPKPINIENEIPKRRVFINTSFLN